MINTLKDLWISQLRDLYDAEKRNLKILTKFQARSTNADLANTFADHILETEVQISRLKSAFLTIGVDPEGETCEATKGLVREAEELLSNIADPVVSDVAIIVSAQRLEHYEIASYGSAATFANELGEQEIERLLKETIAEEKSADEKLKKIAKGGVFRIGVNEVAAN